MIFLSLFLLVFSSICQSASGLCFLACFSLQKNIPCVFRLRFSLLYTLFSYLPVNQLPVCVFLLAFLFKNTYRVFSDFNSCFYTHFSLLYLPISFRFVFFCLLSSLKNTYCVFSDFNSSFFTHFSLIYLPISFRFVFFHLAFLSKSTCRVFSDFNSSFFTHFSLLYLPISFRFVFFCLLFSQKTTF